jgi:hypothetical protein
MPDKRDVSVGVLVEKLKSGELRLPELQRPYVWTAVQVRDLMDSLYRRYPAGSILAWNSPRETPERDAAVEQEERHAEGEQLLLLDGQQRLTSLAAVMRGEPVRVRGHDRSVTIAFNLDHPAHLDEVTEVEEDGDQDDVDEDNAQPATKAVLEAIKSKTFVVGSKAVFADKRWVKVADVFSKTDTQILKTIGINSDHKDWDRYSERLAAVRAIQSYEFVMHVLERSRAYDEVAEIFVRVNSRGTKLRSSDLALAQITAKWQGVLDVLEDYLDHCEKSDFDLEIGLPVRAMVVFATRQSRFKSLASVSAARLKEAWPKAKDGLDFAINLLRENWHVGDEALLSSPYFLIVVAVFAMLRKRELSEVDERELQHWFLVANMFARYSGSSETTLDADLATLYSGGVPSDLLSVVKQQFGRTRLNPNDFDFRQTRSPLFNAVYLALRARGAKDWKSGLAFSLHHLGNSHQIEFHHIFPKAVISGRYEKKEVNEIANMAFLSSSKNKHLGKTKPEIYLPDISADLLKRHAIPTQPDLWKVENYREFLAARRQLLAEAVNQHLDSVMGGEPPAV